jgi:hypothetical protein
MRSRESASSQPSDTLSESCAEPGSGGQRGVTRRKQLVWIELRYRVRALFLTETNPHYPVTYPLRLVYEGAHPVTVEIDPISEDLVQQPQDRHDAVAAAQGKFTASPRVGAMLQDLTVGKVPEGTKSPERSVSFPEEPLFDPSTRVIREGRGVPLDLLPEALQSFIRQSLGEVRDYLVRTIRVMRWRQDSEGSHSPFAHITSRFSLDAETWHPLPVSFSTDVWSHGSLSFRGH